MVEGLRAIMSPAARPAKWLNSFVPIRAAAPTATSMNASEGTRSANAESPATSTHRCIAVKYRNFTPSTRSMSLKRLSHDIVKANQATYSFCHIPRVVRLRRPSTSRTSIGTMGTAHFMILGETDSLRFFGRTGGTVDGVTAFLRLVHGVGSAPRGRWLTLD